MSVLGECSTEWKRFYSGVLRGLLLGRVCVPMFSAYSCARLYAFLFPQYAFLFMFLFAFLFQ